WWWSAGPWMMAKLAFVVLLIVYQFQCYRYLRKMRAGESIPSGLFFRFFNEVTLLMVIPILILVELKPFP
ncbi:MAG: CopD family protein, partial [Pseudomonadales bacterium]|nr:CopD family protein [Pseudomonadales bacterium]